MTGFARAEGGNENFSWAWEAKSVNGKALDIRCRVPAGFDRLEMAVRKVASKKLGRGNVNLTLTLDAQASVGKYRINRDLLDQIMALKDDLAGTIADSPPTLEGLLGVRGLIEVIEPEQDAADMAQRDAGILATLDEAIGALARMRAEEGERLLEIVVGRLDRIEELLDQARSSAAAQPEAVYRRLRTMIDELIAGQTELPEDRLAQEAALIANRVDVREELDRLAVHLVSARALIGDVGPVGRKFDFLCQEFNREANTLCSKASDVDLHRAGLEMKSAIDQLREQIQNFE